MSTKYSKNHEWITFKSNIGTVGITDFAQQQLGDVVLPHSPLRFHGEERMPLRPLPELGEHSEQVLKEWVNYDSKRIDTLIAQGVIACA